MGGYDINTGATMLPSVALMSSDLHSPDSSDISNSVQSMLDVPLEHHTSGSLRRLQSCVHPLNALEANLMLGVTLDDGATHS